MTKDPFKQPQAEEKRVRDSWSGLDLRSFERNDLAKFLNEKGYLTPEKEHEFLKAKGLVSDIGIYKHKILSGEYQEMDNKLRAWRNMKARLNYGEKKKLEQLDRSNIGNGEPKKRICEGPGCKNVLPPNLAKYCSGGCMPKPEIKSDNETQESEIIYD